MSSVSNWRNPEVVKKLLRLGVEAAKAAPQTDEALVGQVMLGVGLHVTPEDLDRAANEALADIASLEEMLGFARMFISLEKFGAITGELFDRLINSSPSAFDQAVREIADAIRRKVDLGQRSDIEATRLSCQAQRMLYVVVEALKSRQRE